MDYERDFKGVWIPKHIWLNDNLTITEKAIFAEIDSLDGPNHCYATNEYLSEFCQVSVPTISRAISKLISYGFLEIVSFDGRKRVLKVVNLDSSDFTDSLINLNRETYQNDKADLSNCEFLLYKENNKENNKETPVPASASKNHSNVYKEQAKLTDDLESEKEIVAQKKERKKKSEYEKCQDEINNSEYNFNDELKEVLREHLDMSFHSKDPKRIKSRGNYIQKLRALSQLIKKGNDGVKVVQQSIDRNWNAFYEVKEDYVKKEKLEGVKASNRHIDDLPKEEQERLYREMEENGVW